MNSPVSLHSPKMGFDCGFDIHPALESTPSNKEKYELFKCEVLRTYRVRGESESLDSVVRVVRDSNGISIEFMVGEQPTIPHSCEYFLRFSSKVSGSPTVRPYIEGVYKIAKKWWGDRVQFWHEMNETGDHQQWGRYDWNEIRAARTRMKEQDKGKHEHEGIDRVTDPSAGTDRLYAIKPIPGKGQSVIATSKILKGTRILSESPLFKVPRHATDTRIVSDLIIKELKGLTREEQRAFFSLHNAHGSSQSPFLGIARTNVLPLGSGASEGGLFLEASRLNHSCRHNAQNTWNATLDQLTIHTLRDIEEGEEITISYLDGSDNYAARQLSLKNSFGFCCECELCLLPPDQRRESDHRLNEMTRLDHLIGDGIRIVSAPLICLHDAHTLLCMLEEECIGDARVARLYYDALQIAIANGDQARAKVFAERAYTVRVTLEGEDSPETTKLKGLLENPAGHRLYRTSMSWKQALKKVPQGLDDQEFEDWLWRKKTSVS